MTSMENSGELIKSLSTLAIYVLSLAGEVATLAMAGAVIPASFG